MMKSERSRRQLFKLFLVLVVMAAMISSIYLTEIVLPHDISSHISSTFDSFLQEDPSLQAETTDYSDDESQKEYSTGVDTQTQVYVDEATSDNQDLVEYETATKVGSVGEEQLDQVIGDELLEDLETSFPPPPSPPEEEQDPQTPYTASDVTYEAETSSAPSELIYEAETANAPSDVLYEAETANAPSDVLYEAETANAPSDVIYEADTANDASEETYEADASNAVADETYEAGAETLPDLTSQEEIKLEQSSQETLKIQEDLKAHEEAESANYVTYDETSKEQQDEEGAEVDPEQDEEVAVETKPKGAKIVISSKDRPFVILCDGTCEKDVARAQEWLNQGSGGAFEEMKISRKQIKTLILDRYSQLK